MSDRETGRVPDVLLERYRLGELEAGQQEAIERRLAWDAEAAERLARLASSDREIEAAHPSEWLAAQVRERLRARSAGTRRSRAGRALSWSAALASAAAVLVAVARLQPAGGDLTRPVDGGAGIAGDVVKGLRPSLTVYRKLAGGSEPLEDGARVRRGDVVRLAYGAAGRGYGAVLSVDGRGVVTMHLPTAGTQAAPLRPGPAVLLDQAYELDDAPGFERFYLVVFDRPFELEPVRRAARDGAASPDGRGPAVLPLPEGLEQSTFLLEKEGTR